MLQSWNSLTEMFVVSTAGWFETKGKKEDRKVEKE